jgi:hypothetical protein
MRNFIVLCFCLVSCVCLGQVKVLRLPDIGIYNLPLTNLDMDSSGKWSLNFEHFEKSSRALSIDRYFNLEANRDTLKNKSFKEWRDKNLLKVNREVYFLGISFLTNEGDKINTEINFSSVDFKKYVYFSISTFVNDVSFLSVDFQDVVSYKSCKFHQKANFGSSYFRKEADFSENTFDDVTNFSRSDFQNKITFNSSTISKEVNFFKSTFSVFASFESIKGSGTILFDETEMPNILNLTKSNSVKIDFRNSSIKILTNRQLSKFTKKDSLDLLKLYNQSKDFNKCVILLGGTNLDNIILPYDRFWADTTGYTYEEKTSLYEDLIKKCKEEGMDESVMGWSIELKKIENIHNFPKIGFCLNYGYTKSLILFWILGVFLLFNILNFFIYPQLISVYFNPKLGLKLIAKPLTQDAEAVIGVLKKSPATRLRYMLHYTGMIFFGIKLEHTDMSFKNLRWVAILYLQFVTGIILLGFALNFVVSK